MNDFKQAQEYAANSVRACLNVLMLSSGKKPTPSKIRASCRICRVFCSHSAYLSAVLQIFISMSSALRATESFAWSEQKGFDGTASYSIPPENGRLGAG
jgi:hypothetical protein